MGEGRLNGIVFENGCCALVDQAMDVRLEDIARHLLLGDDLLGGGAYERPDDNWRGMTLDERTGVVNPLYQGDAGKGSDKRPGPADEAADILPRSVPVT